METTTTPSIPSEQSLRFLAEHLEPRAVVLKGDWGVGKTYYWRENIVRGFFAKARLSRSSRGYAYASLFGLDSIQQVKNKLAYSYEENDPPGVVRRWFHWCKAKVRSALSWLSRAAGDDVSVGVYGVGAGVKMNSVLNDFAFLGIRTSLVCIDDVERRNKNLPIGDVLGLVSYLVEERKCRVVVILNRDRLGPEELAEWERSKEKVFDNELLFDPSIEQSIEIGLRGTEHEYWHETVKQALLRLEISNVRVVARTQRFVRQLMEELQGMPKDGLLEVSKVAALLASAHASKGVGAPSILDIVDPNQFTLAQDEDEEGKSEDQKSWSQRIRNFGLYLGDSLDQAIARSVIDGYPRMDLLVPAASDWERLRKESGRKQLFQAAWDTYHGSFDKNEAELFEAFRTSIPGVIDIESVHNIDATGRILRVLGQDAFATQMFQAWIDARKGERREELDEDSFFPGTKVIDPEFLELLDAARADVGEKPEMNLMDALSELDAQSWSDESIHSLSRHSPEEIADALLANHKSWRRGLRRLATYVNAGPLGDKARLHFLRALKLVEATSALNADRVRNRLGEINLDKSLAAAEADIAEDVPGDGTPTA